MRITSGAAHCMLKAAELSSSCRDAFRKMLESIVETGREGGKVTHTFDFCRDAAANGLFCHACRFSCEADAQIISDIKVDDTFKGFYEFCEGNDIPVVIVSR
jgi:2-hydroxy-3-keto-5-methylthiopentenyl-1-phosphate phosphatase